MYTIYFCHLFIHIQSFFEIKYFKIELKDTYPEIHKNNKIDKMTKNFIPDLFPPLNNFLLYMVIKTMKIPNEIISKIWYNWRNSTLTLYFGC